MARPNINADGYYDDRLPVDYFESKRKTVDPKTVRKLVLIIGGIVAFLAICTVILIMM